MKHILYALTGDPVHFGHLNLIERISKQYDKVTVDVAINETKNPLFTVEERTDLICSNIDHLKNVEITNSKGMLISFADKIGAEAIIKCIRDPKDWEYEKIGVRASQTQGLNHIEFIAYFADKYYEDISSSISKGILFHQGFIHELVPLNVKCALERKMKKQHIIGVTGCIGSGKNYISDRLAHHFGIQYDVHIIDFDQMVHDMYNNLNDSRYNKMRIEICEKFGWDILSEPTCFVNSYFIDRKKLAEKIGQDTKMLTELEEIIYSPLLELYKERVYGLEGIILLNCPTMIESGLTYLCNNNVILVKSDLGIRKHRLIKRGVNPDQIDFFINRQFSPETMKEILEMDIRHDKYGNIFEILNNEEGDKVESEIKNLHQEVKTKLNV